MGLSIESARNRIINTYHIDVEKYASDEIVDEIVDEIQRNVEDIFTFGLKSLLPSIISGVLLLSAAVYFGTRHQSILLGVIFLLCILPIWLGIWILSNILAARSLISGVVFLTNYTINVTRDIVATINTAKKEAVKFSEISFLVLYGIVLPIIKKTLRNKLFSGIIYFFVEKLVSLGTRKIAAEEDQKSDSIAAGPCTLAPAEENDFLRINKKTSDKIRSASSIVFTTLSILGVVVSGLCIIMGIVFTAVLIVAA